MTQYSRRSFARSVAASTLLFPGIVQQLLVAGKAHPADEPAKGLIRSVLELASEHGLSDRVVFVEGYDQRVSRMLLAGCDLWLNIPRRPLEACGTSGMKAAINGTINLSVLDGWWAEAFDGENGWAIPSSAADADSKRDDEDARSLYELLQDEVIPLYYERNAQGLPAGWIAKAKHSMATIIPAFNTRRMLDNYVRGLYRPAAEHAGGEESLNDQEDPRRDRQERRDIRPAGQVLRDPGSREAGGVGREAERRERRVTWDIVVRVAPIDREVARTDVRARHRKVKSRRPEQVVEHGVALGAGQPREHGGRGLGQRTTHADDRLASAGRLDGDRDRRVPRPGLELRQRTDAQSVARLTRLDERGPHTPDRGEGLRAGHA